MTLCFLENVFIVGGRGHRIAESLKFSNWKWNIMDPYPNVKDINSVKIISYNGIYYVFGGFINNKITNDILSFEKETWSRVGSLTTKRIKFSVILNVEKVYVIGGQKIRSTICVHFQILSIVNKMLMGFQILNFKHQKIQL